MITAVDVLFLIVAMLYYVPAVHEAVNKCNPVPPFLVVFTMAYCPKDLVTLVFALYFGWQSYRYHAVTGPGVENRGTTSFQTFLWDYFPMVMQTNRRGNRPLVLKKLGMMGLHLLLVLYAGYRTLVAPVTAPVTGDLCPCNTAIAKPLVCSEGQAMYLVPKHFKPRPDVANFEGECLRDVDAIAKTCQRYNAVSCRLNMHDLTKYGLPGLAKEQKWAIEVNTRHVSDAVVAYTNAATNSLYALLAPAEKMSSFFNQGLKASSTQLKEQAKGYDNLVSQATSTKMRSGAVLVAESVTMFFLSNALAGVIGPDLIRSAFQAMLSNGIGLVASGGTASVGAIAVWNYLETPMHVWGQDINPFAIYADARRFSMRAEQLLERMEKTPLEHIVRYFENVFHMVKELESTQCLPDTFNDTLAQFVRCMHRYRDKLVYNGPNLALTASAGETRNHLNQTLVKAFDELVFLLSEDVMDVTQLTETKWQVAGNLSGQSLRAAVKSPDGESDGYMRVHNALGRVFLNLNQLSPTTVEEAVGLRKEICDVGFRLGITLEDVCDPQRFTDSDKLLHTLKSSQGMLRSLAAGLVMEEVLGTPATEATGFDTGIETIVTRKRRVIDHALQSDAPVPGVTVSDTVAELVTWANATPAPTPGVTLIHS